MRSSDEKDAVSQQLHRNIAARQDLTLIKKNPSDEFCRKRGLSRTLWIPARCLTQGTTGWRRRRSHLISFSPLNILKLRDLSTFKFIDETVGQGRELHDTALYDEAFRLKQKVKRQISCDDGKTRIRITEEHQLARYRDRCLELAESIRTNGVVDMESPAGQAFVEADGLESNIIVTIHDDGNILHYRRGKHRLAIAAVLGLDVPVFLHSISGQFILRFLRRPFGFGSRPLGSAMDRAKNWALNKLPRDANVLVMAVIWA